MVDLTFLVIDSYACHQKYYPLEYNCMSNYKVLKHLPRTFHLIAAACARSLTERSLILTRRYLLSTLMSPLLLVCDDDSDAVDPGKKVVVEEAGEASNLF